MPSDIGEKWENVLWKPRAERAAWRSHGCAECCCAEVFRAVEGQSPDLSGLLLVLIIIIIGLFGPYIQLLKLLILSTLL